jgi:regulator of protease activity HflC (stomatin/prohibitin superfamily)
MSYRILVDKNTPPGQATLYAAQAIEAARVRARREEDRRAEEAARQKQQKENQAEMELRANQQREKEVERQRQVAAARLDSDLRASFFSQNPAANESTFQRLLPALRDDFMKQQTLSNFETVKSRKRARYSSF